MRFFVRPNAAVAGLPFLSLVFMAWSSGFTARILADPVTVDCQLAIRRQGAHTVIGWNLPIEEGYDINLQSAPGIGGPWSPAGQAADGHAEPLSAGEGRFFRVVLTMPGETAGTLSVGQLVRDFAFSSIPQLNPATEFEIRWVPIRGLWPALGVQVFKVRCFVDRQQFNEFDCVIRQGKLTVLGCSIGGYGLMSGVVQPSGFYYTYSWGSGIHRSHIGRMEVVNEELKFWESGGFAGRDLFVSPTSSGGIQVVAGRYAEVNQWLEAQEFGLIDQQDPAQMKIIGPDGEVVETLLPTDAEN
jgi:hypothetical protein